MAVPSNPATLTLTAGVNKVNLSWDASAGSTGYKIYRSENGTSYTLIKTLTATSYEDKRPTSTQLDSYRSFPGFIGLERNKQYWYKVTAYNGEGESTGTISNTITIPATAFSSGSIKGKIVVNLICDSTDHMSVHPTQAQIQVLHDWIRANFTTKITLFISKRILNATSGEDLNVLNYLKTLVATYDYDIVTLPHYAWFPANTTWSAGIANEATNMQTCHDKCYQVFGKYPVSSFGWQYNNDLIQKAIDLGYKIAPSGIREVYGIDSNTCMGIPYQFYKPSKRNINIPGDGDLTNTYDIISGLEAEQWGPYRNNPEPDVVGKSNVTGLGFADSYNSLFGQMRTMQMLLEDSQELTFNDYFYFPCYVDPYWIFMEPNARSGVVLPNGDTEIWYMNKQLMLWMKDRYSSLLDFYLTSELVTYLQTVVTNANPMPVYAHLDYNDYEGQGDQKSLRYESQHYHTITRYKEGLDGYVKMIQYAGYSVILDEPSGLATDWSVPGMYRRTNANPVKDIRFIANGTTYSLTAWQSGYGHVNIHAPAKKVTGETLEMTWDIYDSTDVRKLLSARFTYAPDDYTVSFLTADKSVSNVTMVNNDLSTTTDMPFTYNNMIISISLLRHFNTPFNQVDVSYSNIATKIYSDANCTIDDSTLGTPIIGQVNIINRWLWNKTSIPIAIQLYNSKETLDIVAYSWDGVTYSDPTIWHLLSPGEKHNFKAKVDLTGTSTQEVFSIGIKARG